MKDLKQGQIVFSKAGRDKKRCFAVTGYTGERVLISDGERYTTAAPKKKNPSHLAPTGEVLPAAALTTDQQLKRAIAAYIRTRRPAGTEEENKLV